MNNAGKRTIMIGSIDDFIEWHYVFIAVCNDVFCIYFKYLDLTKLLDRLGGHQSCKADQLAPKLHGNVCHGRDIQLTGLRNGKDGPRYHHAKSISDKAD